MQQVILGLEQLIELLGCEPDRRWENALILHMWGEEKIDASKIATRAKQLADKGNTEDALNLYIKVLEIQPEDADVMDIAAELLAELGDAEGARELITRSIELQPNRGFGKYVLLGHLDSGMDAICAFEKGLELLKNEAAHLEAAASEDGPGGKTAMKDLPDVKKKMAAVFVAMAKVYLTDCFEQRNSKDICEALLDKALEYDSENPEACQALADLRLSQGRRGEALLLINRTVDICDNLPKGLVPTYDFRMVTARLLVELSQYENASVILAELSSEDAEDTEMWYLLGMCFMLMSRPAACKQALTRAKKLLEEGSNGSDAALLNQIEALLQRRTISEAEKEQFWNPRWWVTESGRATDHLGDSDLVPAAPEMLVDLSPNLPSRKHGGARPPALRKNLPV